MAELNYTITIKAPKESVWHAMLDPDTYRKWTAEFHEGSYYDGSWKKGSEIRFVADDDGGKSGIYGRIAENVPYEFISIEYLGEIVDGQVDTESNEARNWIGAHENYRFSETDGVTSMNVALESDKMGKEMADMFNEMWPKALNKLKEISES